MNLRLVAESSLAAASLSEQGRFRLDGKTHQLPLNEPAAHTFTAA